MDTSCCLRIHGFIIVILAAFTVNLTEAADAEEGFEIGKWREINSEVLNEKRSLIVGTPRNYDKSNSSFPVIILLDGDDHFHFVTAATKFLAANGFMPKVLVVGIPNTDRTRDLTPKSNNPQEIASRPTQGGADNFLSFISDELLPWLSKEYRTQGYNVLVGHSYGGLFALHALTTQPDVFDGYIAISPSLQWNDQHLVEQTNTFLMGHQKLKADLYITAGSEGGQLVGGVQKIAGLFNEYSPYGLNWKFTLHERESHSSIFSKGVYEGLEAVFSDWRINDLVSAFEFGGAEGIVKFYENSGKKYGIDRPFPNGLFIGLTYLFIQKNRLDEAAEIIDFNAEDFKPPAILVNMVAESYLNHGNMGKATQYYTKALQIDSNDLDARKGLISLGKNPDIVVGEMNMEDR